MLRVRSRSDSWLTFPEGSHHARCYPRSWILTAVFNAPLDPTNISILQTGKLRLPEVASPKLCQQGDDGEAEMGP